MNEPTAPVAADVLNPFMVSDVEDLTLEGDNPFAASNPFSDFGNSYEPPAGDTVPVDIFGGENPKEFGAKNFEDNPLDMFTSQSMDSEKLVKPTELDLVSTIVNCASPLMGDNNDLEPSARPLPTETQNLILSVTGQMEFTSTHLLDRIPPTRTPSPVSARDIHSPSPTPEPDLLDEMVTEDNFNKDKPVRPPPPPNRPPRPAPPSVPPPRPQASPQVLQSKQQSPQRQSQPSEDINLFDAPAPVTTKPTKEHILSLYSAPKKEEKQIDFLSDDILDVMTSEEGPEMQTQITNIITTTTTTNSHSVETTSIFQDIVTTASGTVEETSNMSMFTNVMDDSCAHMDCSEPMEVTTTQSDTSPFAEHINDQFQQINERDKNPFESTEFAHMSSFAENATNIFSTEVEDTYMAPTNELFNEGQNESESFIEGHPKETWENSKVNAFGDISETNETQHDSIFNSNVNNIVESTIAPSSSDPGWGSTEKMLQDTVKPSEDAFDAFSAKFDSTVSNNKTTDVWGDDGSSDAAPGGFEAEAFDPFLHMEAPPPPAATPRLEHQGSRDSTDDTFSVFIRPKDDMGGQESAVPVLAPPPRPQVLPDSPRSNPFDKSEAEPPQRIEPQFEESRRRSGSGDGGETPPTPLFDEDTSVPLEEFPRTTYTGPGWEMHLRQPNKKKITGQRFWKKMFVRLVYQGDTPVLQLLGSATDKEPLQELPLQACYSVSDIGAQQFDQFGKIFTVKLQYVFYKERPGVRPGQVTKAERITNKLSQFAAYAIQGDYQGVKEFGSDLRKLGLPVEHAPQVSQLFKLGSLSYEDAKQFSCCVEEALFRLPAHRDRALTYKMEEVQLTAVDELVVEQDAEGSVIKQTARVRIFFLGFLSGQ
ncbi:unnamed protein product [Parnassius apollo]|uniref:(apollo) hypothetical protein n=1 Tax=Parnassius apollo TaxID=110799 RepID=A0A8S3XHP1_PARAO|nr:unnamed protein product [Parnassius apollo]